MRTSLTVTLCFLVLSALAPRRSAGADGVALPLPPDDQQETTARLGSGVVGKALPSKPIDDPSVYFPLREKAQTYQVTTGSKAGSTQVLHVAKKTRPNGRLAWRFELSPSLAADGGPGVAPATIASALKKSEKTIKRSLDRLLDADRVVVTGRTVRQGRLYAVKES